MKDKLLIILACILLAVVVIGLSCRADIQTERIRYTVRAGDTLWDIADEHMPEGMDKREYIFNIKKDNGLERSEIYPGMVLELESEVEK